MHGKNSIRITRLPSQPSVPRSGRPKLPAISNTLLVSGKVHQLRSSRLNTMHTDKARGCGHKAEVPKMYSRFHDQEQHCIKIRRVSTRRVSTKLSNRKLDLPDAWDRNRGLCNVGGHHDEPFSGLTGGKDPQLLVSWKSREKWQHLDCRFYLRARC